jgi:L-ascorbate metabolism protein UlaG (beta-lactamase superfamily)
MSVIRLQLITVLISICYALIPAARAQTQASDCLAMARVKPGVQFARFSPTALEADQIQLTFVGHSTFIIESPGGVRIATDYAGYSGGIVPDVVTMNRAHSTHYTDFPDPAIKHVLRGWNPDGGPAKHDFHLNDVRIRNVTTDIRGGELIRIPDGNSIFIFEVAGLCIGHLGHLHHELSSSQMGLVGRLDVILVPVDGGYTMAQVNMMNVLRDLKPRIIIPMHFFGPTTLARFIANARANFDVEMAESPVLVVSSKSLPEKTKVVVLPGH